MFISFLKTSLYTKPRKIWRNEECNQCWKWFKPLALFERTRLAQCVLLSPDCHLTENKSSNQNQVFISPAHKDIGQEISLNYIFKLFANIGMFWWFLQFSNLACFVFAYCNLVGCHHNFPAFFVRQFSKCPSRDCSNLERHENVAGRC